MKYEAMRHVFFQQVGFVVNLILFHLCATATLQSEFSQIDFYSYNIGCIVG